MKILDLTHLIEEAMPVYPETEPPKLTPSNTFEQHGFRETLLTMGSHTGTHMDAPAHMLRDVLSLEAAEYLAAFPLKGVGTDAISIDPMDTVDYPVHKILLGAGFVNTENLCNLASLVGKTFPYATLPLRFKNADGSVRAVAMLED